METIQARFRPLEGGWAGASGRFWLAGDFLEDLFFVTGLAPVRLLDE
jgi:hypothetical protein